MTIQNIERIKSFGIFQNYTNSDTKDFAKYNLFYGWNGSGKSTLSALFRCIETKSVTPAFSAAEFIVNTGDGIPINQSRLSEANLRVRTFNQEFVQENISWDEVVKSILLVDKEKISERKTLEQLKKEQNANREALTSEDIAIQKLENEISKFSSDSARHLKMSLQSIDTTDSYYLNYNKTKFEQFIDDNLAATKDETSILEGPEIEELVKAARPDQKSSLSLNLKKLDNLTLAKAKVRLDDLLKTTVVSQAIQRLVDHTDINSWVEVGLALHKTHSADRCEFCSNPVSEARIRELEAHFSLEYKAFQDRLTKADQWLDEQYIPLPQLPTEIELYDELRAEYTAARTAFNQAISAVNDEIADWHSILKLKIANPLASGLSVTSISDAAINGLNKAIDAIDSSIKKHNHKSSNFKDETSKAKKRLELHYASTEVREFNYHEKKAEAESRTKKSQIAHEALDQLNKRIRELEDSLSNESIGAIQFNDALHRFIGRRELTLRFNQTKKGYEILRNESEPAAGKLSEGEKTAIAFVYFITKLKENDNDIENTIVVVDDPVSSFDSNHLFHAYSFLRNNCSGCKQLFVFTHNFTFFKLVRDWLEGGNRNRKRKNPPKPPNAAFYVIEASAELPRRSVVINADPSLVNYNSEYHYIFARLHEYKNKASLSRDESFLTANLARKLLESFFSFKYPRHRSDIAQLMDCGLAGCKTTDETIKEKIYRFINKYSHSIVIEVNEDSSENLAGESHNVIGEIFSWIKEVDEVHFNEMVEVVTDK